jgi:calcineurin-like phosphoesterase family protein
MDETIIANWNRVVGKHDLVYHLGDFAFGTGEYVFDSYFKRLNGLIVFVKGNHDRLAWQNRNKFYSHSDGLREIEVKGQDITLCHYAMRVWNKSHYGAWQLYGHSHGTLPDDPHARAIDVGVDCHNFTPISFEQVGEIMAKKLFKPIDHHGDRQAEGGIGLSKEDYAKADRKRLYEQLKAEFEP